MEMRNNIPGLIQNLKNVSSSFTDDHRVIGQATVYLTYLYDILSAVENKQENINKEYPYGLPVPASELIDRITERFII